MTRKQQEALAFLVMRQAANIAEYPEIRNGAPELSSITPEQIAKQLAVWMKKLPGTVWDNRLPL